MDTRSPDEVPLVEMLQLCTASPQDGLKLISQMKAESQDFEYLVLARFTAYGWLAISPLIKAGVSPTSPPEEIFKASKENTVDLCEKCLLELRKIESNEIKLTFLESSVFTNAGDMRHASVAEAACRFLEVLRPTRAQKIRGRTSLKILGTQRIGRSSNLDVIEELGEDQTDKISEILFEFPHLIGSVFPVATDVKPDGSKILTLDVFAEITRAKPTCLPGQPIGRLSIAEDGTFFY